MLKFRVALLAILIAACDSAEPERVVTIDITPSPANVVAGQKVQLQAATKGADGSVLTGRVVTWSTNNGGVATVSATGEVTGISPGNATITATSEAVSSSTVVSVTPAPLVVINVTPSPVTVFVGRSQVLNVGMIDATGQPTVRPANFTSSNNAVAQVNANGVVTGVAPGNATITVTAEGRTATVPVVVSLVPVAQMTLTPGNIALFTGNTQQFQVILRDAEGNIITGRPIVWFTSAPSVATVTQNGLATAVGAGSATITANADGQFATARITVTQPAVTIASVEIVPSTVTTNVGSVQVLTAIARDAQGNPLNRTFTWGTSNSTIVTVTQNGVITAVAPGSTTITATTEGRVGSATVNVLSQQVSFTAALFRNAGLDINPGATVTGSFTAIHRVSAPVGFSGSIQVTFGGVNVCTNTITGGAVTEFNCTFDTASTDGFGNRRFPNGATVLSTRVIGANGAVVATSPDVTFTVSNN